MTESLEYRILKHLQENDNGEYLDISFLSENTILLHSKIKDLSNNQFLDFRKILIDEYNRRFDCKIRLKGKDYLLKMQVKNEKGTIIKNDFRGSTIGQFNQESDFLQSTNNIETNSNPNKKVKSSLKTFLYNPWILLISGIAIEEITLGRIYKYIISLF